MEISYTVKIELLKHSKYGAILVAQGYRRYTSRLDEYCSFTKEINEPLKMNLIEVREALEPYFILHHDIQIGKKCIGTMKVPEFGNEFLQYIFI